MMQVEEFVKCESKFPWRMMLITMEDVGVLLEFFKNHVVNIKRGAKVLLERIEDFGGLGSVNDYSIQAHGSVSTAALRNSLRTTDGEDELNESNIND